MDSRTMNTTDENLDDLLKALTTVDDSDMEVNLLEDSTPMTEEEIESLLQKNQTEAVESNDLFNIDADDLSGLLSSLGDEDVEDIKEISDLLDMSDNNEAVDDNLFSLLQGDDEETGDVVYNASDLFSEEEEEEKAEKVKKSLFGRKKNKKEEQEASEETEKKSKREKKREKKHKELEGEETPVEEGKSINDVTNEMLDNVMGRKKGFFQRLFAFLTEEDDAEEGLDSLQLTDVSAVDNVDVPQVDVTDESIDKKKEEKLKKEQEKKEKREQAKRERAASRLSFDVYDDEALTGKKLSGKNVAIIFVVCLVPMIALLLVSNWYMGYTGKRNAVKAYYAGDYLQCYQLLYGQKMNESQQLMYHRSELILRMDMLIENVQEFQQDNKDLEALDKLVQYMNDSEEYYKFAERWNCVAEYQTSHNKLEECLEDDYNISKAVAIYIAGLKSDVEYTKALYNILQGKAVMLPSEETSNEAEPEENVPTRDYDDLLPEEEDRQQADG